MGNLNKSDPDGENTYVKWKKGINEKMSGSRNTEKREKGGEVADGEREVALVEKGLFGGRRAQINNRMIEGGNTEEVHMRFSLTHLPTWIRKRIGLENCKHTRTGVKRDFLGVMITIDSHFDHSLVVYYTHSIVHAIASDNTFRCSIGSQQVSRNVICLCVMKGESENREMAICKYTNDIEINHTHRENHSSILHFKGAKGILLSHIEELREKPTIHKYIYSFL